jgi:hypothetical protein
MEIARHYHGFNVCMDLNLQQLLSFTTYLLEMCNIKANTLKKILSYPRQKELGNLERPDSCNNLEYSNVLYNKIICQHCDLHARGRKRTALFNAVQ